VEMTDSKKRASLHRITTVKKFYDTGPRWLSCQFLLIFGHVLIVGLTS